MRVTPAPLRGARLAGDPPGDRRFDDPAAHARGPPVRRGRRRRRGCRPAISPCTRRSGSVVTEAYERYRGNDSGSRRGLHPGAGGGLAGPVRDRRGRTLGPVVRDRGRRSAVLDPERLQAVRVRPRLRRGRLRGGPAAARRQQHGLPVQLADGRRAERRADDEPAGQRRRDRHHQSRAGRHGGREVGVDPGTAVDVRRTRAHRQRGGLRLRVGHQHAQPGHRPPPQELRAGSTSTPTRRPTSTPASARWT